jgi:hypothetical protein
MRYLVLILLSVLMLNCAHVQYTHVYTSNAPLIGAPKKVIPVYVDSMFSMDDKLAIDNAVNQWNYALNQQMVLNIVSYEFNMEPSVIIQAQREHAFLFLEVSNTEPGIPDKIPEVECRKLRKCFLTLAYADALGGTTVKVVRSRIKHSADLEYIMLHEIGHLLYLRHVDDAEGLMYKHYTKYGFLCVDEDSVQKVAQQYGLDFSHMNYCVAKK